MNMNIRLTNHINMCLKDQTLLTIRCSPLETYLIKNLQFFTFSVTVETETWLVRLNGRDDTRSMCVKHVIQNIITQ